MQIDPLAEFYFQPVPQIICGQEVKLITDEYIDNFASVVDRYFTRYYYVRKGGDQAPYKDLFHSNRVGLICLASEHPALQSGIASVNFDIGQLDHSKNAVKRKGGMILQAYSTLPLLSTKTGVEYKVPSCVHSKLVEVNVRVSEHPELLENLVEGECYFAIVLPKPEHCEEIKASLMTQEQYNEYQQTLKTNSQNRGFSFVL